MEISCYPFRRATRASFYSFHHAVEISCFSSSLNLDANLDIEQKIAAKPVWERPKIVLKSPTNDFSSMPKKWNFHFLNQQKKKTCMPLLPWHCYGMPLLNREIKQKKIVPIFYQKTCEKLQAKKEKNEEKMRLIELILWKFLKKWWKVRLIKLIWWKFSQNFVTPCTCASTFVLVVPVYTRLYSFVLVYTSVSVGCSNPGAIGFGCLSKSSRIATLIVHAFALIAPQQIKEIFLLTFVNIYLKTKKQKYAN